MDTQRELAINHVREALYNPVGCSNEQLTLLRRDLRNALTDVIVDDITRYSPDTVLHMNHFMRYDFEHTVLEKTLGAVGMKHLYLGMIHSAFYVHLTDEAWPDLDTLPVMGQAYVRSSILVEHKAENLHAGFAYLPMHQLTADSPETPDDDQPKWGSVYADWDYALEHVNAVQDAMHTTSLFEIDHLARTLVLGPQLRFVGHEPKLILPKAINVNGQIRMVYELTGGWFEGGDD